MILEILAVIAIGILIYVYLTYYNLNGVYIVRYSRPDCPFCVESQAGWDEFKKNVENAPPEELAKMTEPIHVLDIDTSETLSPDTLVWKSKYNPKTVPAIIAIYKGEITEYTSLDRSYRSLAKFFGRLMEKYGVYKK
jgi:hypothetical protein